MFSNKLNYKLINLAALMLFLYFGFSNIEVWWDVFSTTASVFLPFIIAFAFAYAVTPILNFLISKGLKKKLAVLIITISAILLVVSLFVITLPLVYDQLVSLSKILLEISSDFGKRFNVNLVNYDIKVADYLNSMTKDLGNLLSHGAISIVNKSFNFIGKLILGFITWIYFLTDMDNIRKNIKRTTKSVSNKFFQYIKCLDEEIGNYVKGLTIFMFVQLIEYSILFFLVGHPNWLLLGILAAVTTIIPYIGGLITNIIGIITAAVVSTPVLIGTIVICVVFPQLDGYLISPKIYGKTNNVSPLITIIAISIGGSLGGFLGIIIALPVFLLIRSTFNFYYKDLEKGVRSIKNNV